MKYIMLIIPVILLLNITVVQATSVRSEQILRQLNTDMQDAPGTARIVGGSDTDPGDYPFMAALVNVSQQLSTSLTVNSLSYSSSPFTFSPTGQVSGEIVSCGLAGDVCEGVENRICLIERGEFTFAVKTLNCQAGGGLGAIIYNNVAGSVNGTLGNAFDGDIPVVAISQQDGQALVQLQNANASIEVSVLSGSTQNARCGGTFLGGKWVLTAAHCVDSEFSNQLRVNVGEYDLRDGADQAIPISQIYIHPNYVDNEFDNDVAVLALTREVDAPSIELADAQTTEQFAATNSIAKSIGWGGRIGYGVQSGDGPTGNFPDILQEVELPLLTNSQCRQIFAESRGISSSQTGVTDQMICAALDFGGKSACQGDSGGPLFIESNNGPLQVGITSWGIGCAVAGYPGVYARVGALLDFINATRFGMGITGDSRFTNSPVGNPFRQTYTVTNNSQNTATPVFSLSNSTDFQLISDDCNVLLAGQRCEISIDINAASPGLKQTSLTLTSDIPDMPTNGMRIQGFAVASASTLRNAVGPQNAAITIFSGGDRSWRVNNSGGVISGNIDDRQQSILIAQVVGEGRLEFEWSVSSEENVDEPSEPFDALYLIVNGEQTDFISGDVGFTQQSIELPEGTHLIEWSYRKDPAASSLEDSGSVRNLMFVTDSTDVPQPPSSEPPAQPTSSGGTSVWILLFLGTAFMVRRQKSTVR
ncbi:trypsin-like serine protease [Aliiglaciecola litoralis]|uniref:Peptidase S1 domain-containing protein n=1 Tax=Aliiglaciecola litoralis TaxID=582857 RepID=A0ABN1LG80_9ALTE